MPASRRGRARSRCAHTVRRFRAIAADGQWSSAFLAVGRTRQPGEQFMFLFKKSARARRARAGVKSRLRVEQLETRLTPVTMGMTLEGPPATVSSSGSNTGTSGIGVATDSDGDSVVIWSSNQGGSWNVYGQRYCAGGAAQGSAFRVNTASGYNEQDPSVAMDAAGDFVITWSAYQESGSGWSVYGQRYNSSGVAQGGEFRVNTSTTGDQLHARVAMDSLGNFTVVWQAYNPSTASWAILGQQYTATGIRHGGQFQVSNGTGNKEYPAIAMNGAGAFVVTWSSYGQASSGWGVYARRYAKGAIPQGNEFLVDATITGDQMYSSVGIDGAGDFTIAWTGNSTGPWLLYGQHYSSSGAPQGSQFQVGTANSSSAIYADVAVDGSGNSVITWSGCQNGNWCNCVQQFNASGQALTNPIQLGSTTASYQTYAAVAMTSSGQLVLVSDGACNGCTDVFAQQGLQG